ncbi:MAG: hypothetical protein IKF72_13605 [Kiritimatiellae bacterium]|nr:hypothetical protein [Kiritimatiellia bacterium]
MRAMLYAFLAAVFYTINIPASKVLLRDGGAHTPTGIPPPNWSEDLSIMIITGIQ